MKKIELPECDNIEKPRYYVGNKEMGHLMQQLVDSGYSEQLLKRFVDDNVQSNLEAKNEFNSMKKKAVEDSQSSVEKEFKNLEEELKEKQSGLNSDIDKFYDGMDEKLDKISKESKHKAWEEFSKRMKSYGGDFKKLSSKLREFSERGHDQDFDYDGLKDDLKDFYKNNERFREKVDDGVGIGERIRRCLHIKSSKERTERNIKKAVEKEIKESMRKSEEETEIKKAEVQRELERMERKKHELESRLGGLKYEKDDRKEEERNRKEEEIKDFMASEIKNQLSESGYIKLNESGKVTITNELIRATAKRIFEDTFSETYGCAYSSKSAGILGEEYEGNGRMQTVGETSRIDALGTAIRAKISHPESDEWRDEDIITKKFRSKASPEVIVAIDRSGSMGDYEKMSAAKKSAQAIDGAIREKDSQASVKIIAFSGSVHELKDVSQVAKLYADGTTNLGGAIRKSNEIFQESKKRSKVLYLITDSYPEYSEDSRLSPLEYSVKQAQKFSESTDYHFRMVLLGTNDRECVEQGEQIVKAARGKMIKADPKNLAVSLFRDYWESF